MEMDNSTAEQGIEKHLGSLESLLQEWIKLGPFQLTFSVHKTDPQADSPDAPQYIVDFSGADSDLLLGKNATLLHALEHVALMAIHLEEDQLHRIAFDSRNWRQERVDELRMIAQVAAQRVIDSGDPFALNPMNAHERRIIHLALKDLPQVRTQSEGKGPERKVVIHPAK
jgi:spoIIIJ-associated protein